MSVENTMLGNISENIQTGPFGSQLHQSDYEVDGKIDISSVARVDERHVERLRRHVMREGDIIYARRGDVGKCAYATKNEDGWLCGTGCLRVTVDRRKANPKYVHYYLQREESVRWVENHAIGATMPNLNTSILQQVPVTIPDISVQDEVVAKIGRYDNLIENNRKQIKILEEAAQRLYKEWFIDLRFPGHEKTKIVDGVPEGWENAVFSEKVDIMSGGTPDTSESRYYSGRIPFYSPKDSDGSFFSFDTEIHISEEGLEHCNSKLYPVGTIIITARGTVGKTTILARPMAMNQSCYALRSDSVASEYFLFFALRREIEKLKTMANGGVFGTIIMKTFDGISILLPNSKVIKTFHKTVSPIMEMIKYKATKSGLIQEARDRLLKKLFAIGAK